MPIRGFGSIVTLVNVVSIVILTLVAGGCVSQQAEYACEFYELRPPPDAAAIRRFQAEYPAARVTTTQPGTWDKIEVGMTRGMIRTLVGERLVDESGDRALLRQDAPWGETVCVRLEFAADGGAAREVDRLVQIVVRRTISRAARATDWP